MHKKLKKEQRMIGYGLHDSLVEARYDNDLHREAHVLSAMTDFELGEWDDREYDEARDEALIDEICNA